LQGSPVIELSDAGLGVLQERLPGRPAEVVDADTVAAVVAVNEQFAGLLADHPRCPFRHPPSDQTCQDGPHVF
jgi:hypothetical protein